MNRRRFLGTGVGVVGAAGAAANAGLGGTAGAAEAAVTTALPSRNVSVARAFEANLRMMDAYQHGSTIRIIQSNSDALGLGSTAFSYDNALAIAAYLGRYTRDDLDRAKLLGDSLLYAEAYDPMFTDGRVRQAYWVGPFSTREAHNDFYFVRPDGFVNLVGPPWNYQGSGTGEMAWVGMALAHLFARTRQRKYLDGAVRLGHWIVDNAFDAAGLGGYTFGVDANNQRIRGTKSTEHNSAVYALFTNLLARLTRDPEQQGVDGRSWQDLGRHAGQFLDRMWNPEGGYFYVGSNDGSTINTSVLAEDAQSWPYLALRDARYAAGLDWAKTNLATTDTPQSLHSSLQGNLRLSGVSLSTTSRRSTAGDPPADPDAVWLLGTAQLDTALLARRRRTTDLPTFHGDLDTAGEYLSHIDLSQAELTKRQTVNGAAIPDGMGIVTASSVLDTGFGFSYRPVLHLGTTSWYLFAVLGLNPYQL